MDFWNGLKFVLKQLFAQGLVARGDRWWQSPGTWLAVTGILFAGSLFWMPQTAGKGGLFLIRMAAGFTLLIACRYWVGFLIRNRYREKLADSHCPACNVGIGADAAAKAYLRYAADCERREKAEAFNFGEWPVMELPCPSCQRILHFNRHWNGALWLAWDPDHPEDLPPTPVSMREYLRTGNLGGIEPSDGLVVDLLEAFGEPDATSHRPGKGEIWKYGDIEFHLTKDDRAIWLIYCDSYSLLSLGKGTKLDPWIFNGHPALHEVEAELIAADIPFEYGARNGTIQSLRLGSGVELLVAMAPDEFGWPGFIGLYGFQQMLSNG